jgi:hypothetical protein
MIKKELLEILQECVNTEESATTLYLKHLDAFCTRFDMDKKYIPKIKDIINVLIAGNKKHRRICEDLYKKILEDNKNDY